MAVDQQEFRQVMGHFATGVTVITTHDGKGNLFGLTANAVSSVSLDPPLVLCCIARSSESHAAFAASGVFSVHILSHACLLYTSPSPRDKRQSRMPSSA